MQGGVQWSLQCFGAGAESQGTPSATVAGSTPHSLADPRWPTILKVPLEGQSSSVALGPHGFVIGQMALSAAKGLNSAWREVPSIWGDPVRQRSLMSFQNREKGPWARRWKAGMQLGCRAQGFSQPPGGWVARVDMLLEEW